MSNLSNLGQPTEFWEYFEQISRIPRCSNNEERVRNFIKDEAEKFGFTTIVDNVGNLIVIIPANSTQKEICILQCHLDMVCEKNEAIIHDFLKDPLKLKIIEIENEKWITAEGTTLGADNGTGICYLLTLMKKIHSESLKFDSLGLNLIFTVREEYDMGGAKNIHKDLVNGKYLINLDSGRDGKITVGCVGGIGFIADIKTNPIEVDQINEVLRPFRLTISGLIGGHSGGDCNKGRGHAIKILSEILWKLSNKYPIYISSINGGGAANAIPREAKSIVYIKENLISDIESTVMEHYAEIKKQFEGIEHEMDLSIEEIKIYNDNKVFSKKVQEKLLQILCLIPSGPLSLHPRIKKLPFTSTNLGIIKTEKDHIRIRMLHRSLSKYYNRTTCEKVISLLEMSGLEIDKRITGSYPPWKPNFDFKLLNLAKNTYYELHNKEAKIIAIHGGLESTLLINLNPEIEAIAIGPTTKDLHSPNERVQVNSVERIWNFLINILKKLD